jgi:uncharacterized membrane protein YhaH (DUF805 family)
MWKNYVNFSDRTNLRGYWMAFLLNFVAGVILGIIAASAASLSFLSSVYSVAVFLPGLGLAVRRLRDAGKKWYNVFWIFLPLIGLIILIVLLCKPSVEEDGVPVV